MWNFQEMAVAILVLSCAVYATWSFMPSLWRRSLASRVAQWSGLPVGLRRRAMIMARSGGGCGCDGCDGCASAGSGSGATTGSGVQGTTSGKATTATTADAEGSTGSAGSSGGASLNRPKPVKFYRRIH